MFEKPILDDEFSHSIDLFRKQRKEKERAFEDRLLTSLFQSGLQKQIQRKMHQDSLTQLSDLALSQPC